jgi:hypothetical protein
MQLLAQPLSTDERYQKSDGTYDLQKRLDDKRADDEQPVDPAAAFARADLLFSEQRWLVIGSILLAVSLFWLALAEISTAKWRNIPFVLGLAVYLIGILWFLGVEIVFFFLHRGAA